jgi:hypothetical protein
MSEKEALDILNACDPSGEYKTEGIELGGDIWMEIAEMVTGENPYTELSNEGDEKLWNFRLMIEEELGIELY